MSTELSLRKLAKIVRKLDNQITDTRQELRGKLHVTINVHDPLAISKARITTIRQEALDLLDRIRKLTSLRGTVRGLLGKANESAGVNAIVTEQRSLEAYYEQLKHATSAAKLQERLSDDQLEARVTAATHLRPTQDIYGRADVSVAEITMAVFTDEQLTVFEAEQRSLLKKIELLQDRLERINTSVTVPLEDTLATELAETDAL